jgi:glutaredoxin
MQVKLYTTLGCHLCEQAESLLLLTQQSRPDLEIISQEIGDDDDLVARYGIRIPVVAISESQELGWPFDLHQLENFLNSAS